MNKDKKVIEYEGLIEKFTWDLADSGYELTPSNLRNQFLSTKLPGSFTHYKPFEVADLFREFAFSVDTRSILQFANKYGFLTKLNEKIELSDGRLQEPLTFWKDEVLDMFATFHLWNWSQIGDLDALSKYIFRTDRAVRYCIEGEIIDSIRIVDTVQDVDNSHEQFIVRSSFKDSISEEAAFLGNDIKSVTELFEDLHVDHYFFYDEVFTRGKWDESAVGKLFVQRKINNKLAEHALIRLLWNSKRKASKLHFFPRNLLGVMWFQFARAVDGEIEYRRCAMCKKFLEISLDNKTGYRADRETCSSTCRSRLFRMREKAQDLIKKKKLSQKEVSKVIGTKTPLLFARRKRRVKRETKT